MRSIACVAVLCLFSLWGYSKSRALKMRAAIMRAFGNDATKALPRDKAQAARASQHDALF